MVLVALSMIFAALLLVANVTAVKIIAVGTEGIDAGILAYPFTFLISDVISEIYGRKITSKIIWMGFVVSLIMVAMFYIAGQLPAAGFWEDQRAYDQILGSVPRIVLASMIAYLVSQHHDVIAFHMWKKLTKGRFLWLRNNASTLVSQAIDTVLFVTIAFVGVYAWYELWGMIWVTYLIKMCVAIADTPLVYGLVYLVRKNNLKIEEI
ncbi:MAG: queuosine precursor transporter [SAR202 cluster bacterium]|nr:queuosine precursor transporter [SAR202 cluster bacterium]|tara:strand:- start:12337 stop:12960 length:624 start_codon:yes stop_codon:yes gene_type:complete